jgi:hypothetical protein
MNDQVASIGGAGGFACQALRLWPVLATGHSEALLQLLLLIASLGVFQVVFESLGDLFGIPPDNVRVFAIIVRPQVRSVLIEVLDRVPGVRGGLPEKRQGLVDRLLLPRRQRIALRSRLPISRPIRLTSSLSAMSLSRCASGPYCGFALNCRSWSASSATVKADASISCKVSLASPATVTLPAFKLSACAVESAKAINNADVMERFCVVMAR